MKFILVGLLAASATVPLIAMDGAPAATEPDNAAVNKRDRDDKTATPEDQSEVKVLASIRRALTKDDTISTNGHNVKIMFTGGVATLRGPVKDEAEKQKIADLVGKTEGVTSVDNQLEVSAK